MAAQSAADFVPATHNLADLTAAAQGCKGCDLYLHANQTVFGAGSPTAGSTGIGCTSPTR